MERETGLIVALDVLEQDSAIQISSEVAEYVDAIKVGYPLVLSEGIEIISKLADYAPVIADFKVADIPNTDMLICGEVFKQNASGVIVHGFTGEDSLRTCVEVANANHGDIYVVSEMSHPGGERFFQTVAEEIAEMAKLLGATGVVAPATRPERLNVIRNAIGDSLSIISPGVGAQGGSASDAIAAGADWVIVGRSIYNSDNPKESAEKIASEIKPYL
ncbi:orotidine-5'-phosphate decarboxylase [Methanohalophilus levihalophilus]|uniref:orotidine-5'-phosphate decarboxylase n=1 Tax=Methanohalophilus levihalophilus TaxID=1431282 RepID=UPI001AE9E502|nr:orotidine-5'-phosphate decarboxylase [Methanohalophilus levihalophilus]MBP2029208.1 orotidine-5'-phosphate decarboxylase [Methanohalophilus levihalophilus]